MRTFTETYFRATFASLNSLVQMLIVALDNNVTVIDEIDLKNLAQLLGIFPIYRLEYFLPGAQSPQPRIYFGDIEYRKAVEAVESIKQEGQRKPIDTIYNKSERVKRHASSLAGALASRFPDNKNVPEMISVVFEAPIKAGLNDTSVNGLSRVKSSRRSKQLNFARASVFNSEPLK